MRTTHFTTIFLTIFTLLTTSANAHEFWIQHKRISTEQGEFLTVHLMHGERFLGDIVPTDQPQISRYQFINSDSETTNIAYRHMGKTSFAKPTGPGVLVYESNLYTSTLQAEKFESYLKEEHLHNAIQDRADRNESDAPGRELYARCAKSILNPSDEQLHANEIDREVGLPLEIMIESIEPSHDLETIQTSTQSQQKITAIIKFEGQPINDLRVVAASAKNPENLIELSTDQQGRVSFQADTESQWMITTLHIERLPQEQSSKLNADWISYWSSITFDTTR